jgi:hypothetical protein
MRVLIQFPREKMTATFETRGPPCLGCAFYRQPRDDAGGCLVAAEVITGAVLKECSDKKRYTPKDKT